MAFDPSQTVGAGGGAGIAVADNAANSANKASTPTAPNPFQQSSARLNPFVDSRAFRTVSIAGVSLPGVILSIDGAGTPEDWNDQKPTNGNYATAVWKGSKLADAIKIKMALHDRASFDRAYTVRDALRPKRGEKPPSLAIANAIINFGGITRIGVKDVGFPKWEAKGGYWTWEIELKEYNPSASANTGPADPNKPSNGGDTANSSADKARQETMDAVNNL